MTIIVASLFLPYQPQFEVKDTNSIANELVESNLVKIENPNEIPIKKRSSSVHSNSTSPFLGKNLSQENLSGSPEPVLNSQDLAGIDEIVTSEQFLENLTANATTSGTPSNQKATGNPNRNASVEEFFSSSNAASDQVGSPVYSISSGNINDSNLVAGNSQDTTANLLKGVNKSLLVHSVLNNVSNPAGALEGGTHYSSSTSSSNRVITPKSRVVPEINSAVVNIAKVKQKHQQLRSLPSMKRVQTSSLKLSSSPSSNLKYSHAGPINESYSSLDDSVVLASGYNEKLSTEEEDSDSDLETDSAKKYNVPRFGGYSSNAKAKAALLRNSHELFRSLPWKIVPTDKGNGGLKNAVYTAVREKTITDPVSWVGTVGIPTDEIPNDISEKITETLEKEFNSNAVITDDITFKSAYKNFCKQILWPTLHYQIPDNPNSKAFEDHSWNFYKNLNQQFADKIVEIYKVGDTIWIHDYHLMLVPAMVRQKLPHAKIGFFLHVSFPSSEVFRCFPQRENILEGILGANSVGFQTKEYARHFLQTSNRLLMADVQEGELKYKGNIISINCIPVGVDAFTLNNQLKSESVLQWRHLIKERWTGKKIIICRDQFDKTRGLNKKMLAYERFLKENPECIEKVVLIQICLGKADDPELERQVMIIVDRINSLSSNISTSQPVVFLHQELDFPQYLALCCEADLFIVNSLREGMNLTSHEFVVCSEEKNAPLLLSEFTGSASVLKEGSILINPWDIKRMANMIKFGLLMSPEERRRNWKKLMKSVINHDSDNWIMTSLQTINNSWEFNQERTTVFNLSYDTLYGDYKSSKKHLFIFKISEPPTPRVLSILNEISAKNIVFVMNSFSKATLESLYTRVNNIGLIAENGAYIRLNNSWYNIVEQVDWKTEVVKILDDKVERLPGSYYKIADSMIRFHTENAEDQERVAGVVGEAITHINTLFDERDIHAYVHKNIVFVQQTGLSLSAVQFLLKFYNSSTDPTDNNNIPVTNTDVGFMTNSNSEHHIEFACVTGSSSPVIEPLFKLVKEEVQKKNLRFGHSIVYGDTSSTYAKEHINGLNELFSILQNLSKMEASDV